MAVDLNNEKLITGIYSANCPKNSRSKSKIVRSRTRNTSRVSRRSKTI